MYEPRGRVATHCNPWPPAVCVLQFKVAQYRHPPTFKGEEHWHFLGR